MSARNHGCLGRNVGFGTIRHGNKGGRPGCVKRGPRPPSAAALLRLAGPEGGPASVAGLGRRSVLARAGMGADAGGCCVKHIARA
ncbi:hypothetical protein RSPO_m00264 (plasmid) [Ralstonia solanacearum Po82]|uniref:Uncharacterized protein n=1 Tax=Ralstonia solanacearum (strain Po82) TaxID=1031711 RepID=F6G7G9_RALS8|nr:hypothetical protein RSPO_m00264 [Ralstonia solanacearum Po82]